MRAFNTTLDFGVLGLQEVEVEAFRDDELTAVWLFISGSAIDVLPHLSDKAFDELMAELNILEGGDDEE